MSLQRLLRWGVTPPYAEIAPIGNGRGFLGAEGSHAFTGLITDISKSIQDPQTGVTIFERQRANRATEATTTAAKKEILNSTTYPLGAMGSGSDYSSFIQHVGIPSLNIGFGGENEGGEYHSIYDSYDHYARFKDAEFKYGVTLAKTSGRAVLRLSEADVLPFDFTALHKTIKGYITELVSNVDALREKAQVENDLIKNNAYTIAADPTTKLTTPTLLTEVPFVDFSSLLNALATLEKSAQKLEQLKAGADANRLAAINAKIYSILGQEINSVFLNEQQNSIDVSHFQNGIYLVKVETVNGIKTFKVIKN